MSVRLIRDQRLGTIHVARCPLLVDGDRDLVPYTGLEATLGDEACWCHCVRAAAARTLAANIEREVGRSPLGERLRQLADGLGELLAELAEGLPKPRPLGVLLVLQGGRADRSGK